MNQDVSGMNPFLFRQLEKEWHVIVEDVPLPKLPPRYIRMMTTFHPRVEEWKSRLNDSVAKYYISERCFKKRSRYARALVAKHKGDFDVAFQISGLFNSFSDMSDRPCVIFCSFNTYLAYTEWRPWAPFESHEEFSRWYALEKELYHRADKILCTNNYVKRSLVEHYGLSRDRLCHIGYGINFDHLPDAEKTYAGKLAVFMGYDFERKGGPTVVEAFRLVLRDVPDARLRIIGPSNLCTKGFPDQIEYLGEIKDRSEIERHFREASFFVMPSVCEPFGLVFLEAMAYKNPCIGSTNDAMPEIIEHGKTGYLVTPGKVDELARHMKHLFCDTGTTQQMGLASFYKVQRDFIWSVCGEKVRRAFSQLHSGGSQ